NIHHDRINQSNSWFVTIPRKKTRRNKMKTKEWVINVLIAALYVTVTGFIAPLSFGAYQFRIGEMLNHLVVFNKKYIPGIVGGVFLSNLLFSEFGGYDLIFGVGH